MCCPVFSHVVEEHTTKQHIENPRMYMARSVYMGMHNLALNAYIHVYGSAPIHVHGPVGVYGNA